MKRRYEVLNFVHHFPTHSTVWQLMEGELEGNDVLAREVERGNAFIDGMGKCWMVHMCFFTTKQRAREFAERNDFWGLCTVTVIHLS